MNKAECDKLREHAEWQIKTRRRPHIKAEDALALLDALDEAVARAEKAEAELAAFPPSMTLRTSALRHRRVKQKDG